MEYTSLFRRTHDGPPREVIRTRPNSFRNSFQSEGAPATPTEIASFAASRFRFRIRLRIVVAWLHDCTYPRQPALRCNARIAAQSCNDAIISWSPSRRHCAWPVRVAALECWRYASDRAAGIPQKTPRFGSPRYSRSYLTTCPTDTPRQANHRAIGHSFRVFPGYALRALYKLRSNSFAAAKGVDRFMAQATRFPPIRPRRYPHSLRPPRQLWSR
jgi:hypothetical protein